MEGGMPRVGGDGEDWREVDGRRDIGRDGRVRVEGWRVMDGWRDGG